MAAAHYLTHHQIPQLSPSSTSSALSDGVAYPFFARTPPSDARQSFALADLVEYLLQVERVTTVNSEDTYGASGMQEFKNEAHRRRLQILASTSFDAAELWNDVDGTFERVACTVTNQDGMVEDIFRESKNADGTQNPNNMQNSVVFKQISVWETGISSGNQTGNIKELGGSDTFLQVKKAKQHGYETILAIPIWRHDCLASPCIFFAYSKERMDTSELCLNFVKSALARICNRNNKLGLVDVMVSSSSESDGSSGSFQETKQEGDFQQSPLLGYQQFQQFHNVQQQIQGQMPLVLPVQLQQQQQRQQQQMYQQYQALKYQQPLYQPQQHPQMQQAQPPFQDQRMAQMSPPTFYMSQPNGQVVPVPQHYIQMMQGGYPGGAIPPPGKQSPAYHNSPPQAGEKTFLPHEIPPTLDHFQQPKPQMAKAKADRRKKKTKKVASASSASAKMKKPSDGSVGEERGEEARFYCNHHCKPHPSSPLHSRFTSIFRSFQEQGKA